MFAKSLRNEVLKDVASVSLRIRKSQVLNNGLNDIFIRFYKNNKYSYIKTGVKVHVSDWNFRENQIKKNSLENISKNKEIMVWITRSLEIIDDCPQIDLNSFKRRLFSGDIEKSDLFFEFFRYQIDWRSENSLFAEKSVNLYRSVYHKCLAIWPDNIKIDEVDLKRIRELEKYCLKKRLSVNTIKTYSSQVKSILSKASKDGHVVNSSVFDYKIKRQHSQRTSLTENELKLYEKYYRKKEHKDLREKYAIKLFLFSCYTGLRFLDIVNLKPGDIRDGVIIKKIKKSNQNKHSRIPLLPKAKTLLDSNPLFPFEYNHLVNRRIQKVSKEIGIDKHITFHCARHTFATLALNFGIPIEVISELLSHSDIKTTQIYAKMNSKTIMDQMKKFKI